MKTVADKTIGVFTLRDLGFRPNHSAQFVMSNVSDTRDYEFISYPYLTASNDLRIMVREKDKPQTVESFRIPDWALDFA